MKDERLWEEEEWNLSSPTESSSSSSTSPLSPSLSAKWPALARLSKSLKEEIFHKIFEPNSGEECRDDTTKYFRIFLTC